jgi:hypothetical protein
MGHQLVLVLEYQLELGLGFWMGLGKVKGKVLW